MNRIMLIVLLLVNAFCIAKPLELKPSSEVFSFTGRFDLSNSSKIKFGHSGNQIKFLFKGDQFKLGLSDISNGGIENKNFFNIVINGEVKQVIESSLTKKYHLITVNSPDSFAMVKVFKRTEATCATAIFHGVKFEEGKFKKAPSNSRRIEWVGDSFMAGYGNLEIIAPPPSGNPNTGFHAKNEDGYQAFGAIASRNLKADYSSIVVSGHGVYRNFDKSEKGTLPDIYSLVYPDNEFEGNKFEFSYNPHLIVIKIGTNDFGAEMSTPPDMADSVRFVETYLNFLKLVVEKNSNSKIVLAVGGGITDWFPAGLKRLSRFRSWVTTVKLEAEQRFTNKFGFFEFQPMSPPYGEDWHPTVNSQIKFADEITPYLKEFMKW